MLLFNWNINSYNNRNILIIAWFFKIAFLFYSYFRFTEKVQK